MKAVWALLGLLVSVLAACGSSAVPDSTPSPLTLACVPTSGPAGSLLTCSVSGFAADTDVFVTVGEATLFGVGGTGEAETARFSMTVGPPLVIGENVLVADDNDPATPAATATFTLIGPW